MAGSFDTILKVGLVGVVGYWIYETYFSGASTASGTFRFNASRSGSVLLPGDTWTVSIAGAAKNAAVVATGGVNGASAVLVNGVTDANGNFIAAGQIGAGDVGTWAESWSVGGTVIGTLAFSVIANPATAAAASSTSTASTTSTTTAATSDNSYQKMVAAMQAATDAAVSVSGGVVSATPYVFNAYLAAADPSVANATLNMTTAFPGVDLTKPMTAAAYWAGMGPYLAASGLSGLGRLAAAARAMYPRRFPPRRYRLGPKLSPNYVRIA